MKDKESFIEEGQHSGNAWEWHQVWCRTRLALAIQFAAALRVDSSFIVAAAHVGWVNRTMGIGTTILNESDRI